MTEKALTLRDALADALGIIDVLAQARTRPLRPGHAVMIANLRSILSRANSSDVNVPRVTDEMVTEIMKRLGRILNDLAFVYGDESEAGEAVHLFRRLHSALQSGKPRDE